MALTRIKNNQITDDTIDGAAKIAPNSVTGGELAPSIVYSSDLTVNALAVDNLTIDADTISSTGAVTIASGVGTNININPGAGGSVSISGTTDVNIDGGTY